MPLSRSRRMYALGLTLCVGALGVDKLFLRPGGGPESAAAGIAAAALGADAAQVQSLLEIASHGASDDLSLAQRLEAVMSAGGVSAGAPVFGTPVAWTPMAATGAAGDGSAGSSGPVLSAVLEAGGQKMAIIDGRPRRVGDRVGAAVLIEVGPASAALRQGDRTTVLRLSK